MDISKLSKGDRARYKAAHPVEYKAYISALRSKNGKKGSAGRSKGNYLKVK